MIDTVDKATRSRMMAGIRSKGTRPELIVRRSLHAQGFRFRLHVKELPGKPDLVFPKYNAVIFVNGCFWHGHECEIFKWPSANKKFWRDKIERNAANDAVARRALRRLGWRVMVLWECSLRRSLRTGDSKLVIKAANWLRSAL